MINRRTLKKAIKMETDILIEDAFIEKFNGDKKMDQVIDDLIDKRYDMISAVSNYPKNAKRAEVKSHFTNLKKDLNATIDEFAKKIGHVG